MCTVPPHPQFRSGVLEMTAIDVGQGDSILLVSPQGKTLLVDTGGLPQWMHSDFDIGEDVVSPYLWSRGIHRLDAVAITHAHSDHMGGMAAVLANFHPRELWLGVESRSPELQKPLEDAKRLGVVVIHRKAGDNIELGGSTVSILAPASNFGGSTLGRTTHCSRATAGRSAQDRSSRQYDFNHTGTVGRGSSTLRGHLFWSAECLRPSANGSTQSVGAVEGSDISHRLERSRDFLSGWKRRQRSGGSLISSLISTSAVSSFEGDRRYSSINRRASAASSSRTRMTVPPTPGRISC